MEFDIAFWQALAATIVTEIAVLLLVAPRLKIKEKGWRLVATGLVSSMFAMPYVWFVVPLAIKEFYLMTAIGQSFALASEIVIYKLMLRASWKRVVLLAIATSIASFLVGLVLY